MAVTMAKPDLTNQPLVPRYSMVLEWDPEGQVYVVTIPELPGCNSHGSSYEDAARKGAEAIEAWVTLLIDTGLPVPAPRPWQP
jgi:predicted RNase H-like HicB family nuclease